MQILIIENRDPAHAQAFCTRVAENIYGVKGVVFDVFHKLITDFKHERRENLKGSCSGEAYS